MRGAVPALLLALLIALAGCAGLSADAPTDAGTTPTDDSPTTDTPTPTPAGDVSVEYVLAAGDLPDGLRSANVTLRVVFVEREGDLGPCWSEVFTGPYQPTPTPIPPPEGDCHRSRTASVDLADVEGDRSLGTFTAPASFAAGHGLVVTDATATYENGTTTTAIRGTGGHLANEVRGRPDGRHRVRLRLEAAPAEADYRYQLVSEPVEDAG